MAIFGRAFPIRPWISKPQPTAGGNTYNVSVTEAASATDTLDAAAVFANSFTESGSATDTPSAAAIFANTVSESGSATDTDSSAAVFGSSIAETGAANDSGDATGAFGAAITEAASATDSQNATGGSGGIVPVGGGAGEPHTFSRRRWEELRKALHDARHKALTDERKKKREALDRAADAAAHALAIVRKEEEELTRATIAKMGAMTRALEAATSAAKLTTVLREANAVVMLAKTIERQIADEEDEDDAVMLLLS